MRREREEPWLVGAGEGFPFRWASGGGGSKGCECRGWGCQRTCKGPEAGVSPGIWVGRELLWLEGRWKVGSGQIELSVRLLLGMESWERRDLMDGQSGCRA